MYNFSVSFYYTIPVDASEFTVPHLGSETALQSQHMKEDLYVYKSENKVSFRSELKGNYRLRLTDVSGKVISDISGLKKSQTEVLQGVFFPGIYLLQFEIANQVFIKKIII